MTLTLLSAQAPAQDEATIQAARERFQEGVAHYDQREYEKARLAFLQAYALKPHPAVLLNLAQSELRADKPANAATHFAKYLRENPDASEAERQEAELGFAAARSKVAEVDVTVDVEGATLFVDGEEVGKSPLPGPLYLAPGTHTIEARTTTGKTATAQVSAGPGQSDSTTLTLAGPPPSAAAGPPAPPPVPGEEGEGVEGAVDVSTDSGGAGQWVSDHPLTLTSAVLAVAAGATGVTFAVLAKQDFDNANDLKAEILAQRQRDIQDMNWPQSNNGVLPGACELTEAQAADLNEKRGDPRRAASFQAACAQFEASKDDGEQKEKVAIVGFVGAGVFTAGAIGFYFLEESMHEDDMASRKAHPFSDIRARLVPIATPTTQGFSVVGTF